VFLRAVALVLVLPQEHALAEPASVDEKQQLQQQSGPEPDPAAKHNKTPSSSQHSMARR